MCHLVQGVKLKIQAVTDWQGRPIAPALSLRALVIPNAASKQQDPNNAKGKQVAKTG